MAITVASSREAYFIIIQKPNNKYNKLFFNSNTFQIPGLKVFANVSHVFEMILYEMSGYALDFW